MKIFKLIASLFLFVGIANAEMTDEEREVFVSNDRVVESGGCEWKCRETKEPYKTRIIGFDIANGETFCKVYKDTDYNTYLKFNASKINKACVKEIADISKNIMNSTNGLKEVYTKTNIQTNSVMQANTSDTSLTFTRFLASFLTLNPNIIDREATEKVGELTLKDGITTFSVLNFAKEKDENINRGFWERIKRGDVTGLGERVEEWMNRSYNKKLREKSQSLSSVDFTQTSVADGFNKNNMAYFSNLFLANEKIYQHLQILIFILVGGFFVSRIGTEKIQVYLENRGESSGKQPYLHKFYIPIIMVGTFFMPIPEANNLAHSTIVQNIIRYFAVESTRVADIASATINKVYLEKIYKSLGILSPSGIDVLVEKQAKAKYTYEQINKIYENTCKIRFPEAYNAPTLEYISSLTEEDKKKLQEKDRQDFTNASGSEYDITLEACILLEVTALNARNEEKKQKQHLDGVIKAFDKTEMQSRINALDGYFSLREQQLGWLNSILTPTSSIASEIIMFANDRVNEYDLKETTRANTNNALEAVSKGHAQNASEDEINDSWLAMLGGQLVYMTLPGATAIKEFVKDNSTKINTLVGGIVGTGATPIGSMLGSVVGYFVGTIGGGMASYATAIYLMHKMLSYLPLVVCATASAIAFVSYLVSLCKYFYISPFVVAFALTTKKMEKIVEFLVSGIAIFLKPVLIVLFIGLALFIYTLVDEVYLFLATEQFSGIKTDIFSPMINFTIGSVSGMLEIFAKLASVYVMWKLIISGPAWVLSLVGVDGKQDDMISQGIENNLAKKAFVA
ncbi:hypothetical protein LMG7974_01602 [Campylobacter majalis]|uniref:Uncharacterized protein n=1 Tax=Campylobacter majalis TaxID=2790656 RepID=A0ABM8Q959_9BACT|nr:hypothetical protein [Campylobacter majalis]CAD7289525.1 hypothetical protein LMG7974_01602 [Campylobacter majalis]